MESQSFSISSIWPEGVGAGGSQTRPYNRRQTRCRRLRDRHGNSWSTECDLGSREATTESTEGHRMGMGPVAGPSLRPTPSVSSAPSVVLCPRAVRPVFHAMHGPSPPTAKQELAGVQRLAWPCHPFLDAKWTSLFFGGPLGWQRWVQTRPWRPIRAPTNWERAHPTTVESTPRAATALAARCPRTIARCVAPSR